MEIGAHHPTSLSQTWLLEKNRWKGVLIEPLPHLADKLRKKRKNSIVFECAVSEPGKTGDAYILINEKDALSEVIFEKPKTGKYKEIKVRTINEILSEAKCKYIDFLSIDIEGMEIPALTGFDFLKYKPKLIIIEDHCANLVKHRFLKEKGYKIVNRSGCNNWYIPKGLRYTGKRMVSRLELIRKLYLELPFRIIRQNIKSKKSEPSCTS
ncbi:MAG: FkbM family methyltransferase [Bacillota bacterium]|nr:FkbM family methyltransferase [Bacillota bacterium]